MLQFVRIYAKIMVEIIRTSKRRCRALSTIMIVSRRIIPFPVKKDKISPDKTGLILMNITSEDL